MLIGIAFNVLGYYLMEGEEFKYGWAMIIGTIDFGIGFLLLIYSLIRKLDRSALLKDRSSES